MTSMDPETQENFVDAVKVNPFDGYYAKIYLPYGSKRAKLWYGVELAINAAWLVLLAIFTFGVDSSCGGALKVDGEIVFWIFALYTALAGTFFYYLYYSVEESQTVSFLTTGFIFWASSLVVVTSLFIYECIITSISSFTNVAGCGSIYYSVMWNNYWLIFPIIKLVGPSIRIGWEWFNQKIGY